MTSLFPANGPAIAKTSYTHEDIIDQILQNPSITQRELAKLYGYTEAWVSIVINSDAFQTRLAERKAQLVDPIITATLEERFKGLANLSLNVLEEKLESGRSAELALKALEIAAKAAGFGANQSKVAVQQNFVIQVPTKSADAESWAATYGAVTEG